MNAISLHAVPALLISGLLLFGCQDRMAETAFAGPAKTRSTAIGTVLTDESGMTLYTHKDDPRGGSVCSGRCARSWPPFRAEPGERSNGRFSIIERKDGMRQWAYDDKALYGWKNDRKPGDTTGDTRGGVWFAARP